MPQVSQLVDHEVKTIIAFDRFIIVIPIELELLSSFYRACSNLENAFCWMGFAKSIKKLVQEIIHVNIQLIKRFLKYLREKR